MLLWTSADVLSIINAENGALLATVAAAIQSQNAMADDCRAHLAVLHADLGGVFYDRPSECDLRATDSIWLAIEHTEMELEQIESDALAILATIAERCDANAARAIQLQAHTAELLCRMGELNTHVTTGQAILSDKGEETHASSHIGYILISKHNAMAVRRFGIDADRDLMVDFYHAALFADIGVCQVLGLKRTSPQPQLTAKRKSKPRYSDKPSVAQFGEFAGKLYAKRRVHERVNELIGGLVLDAELAAEGARERATWITRSGVAGTRFTGEPPVGQTSASEAESTKRYACWARRRARRTRSTSARWETPSAPATRRTRSASAKAFVLAPSLLLSTAHAYDCSSN